MPVIQTRVGRCSCRGFVAGRVGLIVGQRLGDRLERRERPRRDRPGEARDRRTRPSPECGAGSRGRSRPGSRRPAASIRQVTSIPFVAPPRWTKRSRQRRPARSTSRDRQATGRPSPRTGTSGRRATISAVSRPSPSRSTGRHRDVVGQQPRPALDVAGEAEHEARRARQRRSRACSSRRHVPGTRA